MNFGKTLSRLRADPRVADIEDEGLEAGRFFVHLAPGYSFDSMEQIRTRSFSNAAEATKDVRLACVWGLGSHP